MMKCTILIFFLGIVFHGPTVRSYPSGAPSNDKVCQTLVPGHRADASVGSPPFRIIVNQVKQHIQVSFNADTEYRGIVLQARLQDGKLGGRFTEIDDKYFKLMTCVEGPAASFTHKSIENPKNFNVIWTPPVGYKGSVTFNSTVVEAYDRFWVGLQSESLEITGDDGSSSLSPETSTPSSTTPPNFTPETSSTEAVINDPFYDGCSVSKLCFGFPNNCVQSQNCITATTVTARSQYYEFEIRGRKGAAWAGVGLSDDNKMGDDSVIECVQEGQNVQSYMSWTTSEPGVSRLENPKEGITLVTAKNEDGFLYCLVRRDIKTTIKGREFDLSTTPYNLLVASGTSLRTNSVAYHDISSLASEKSQLLSDVSTLTGSSKLLIKLHGAFMLAAWIGYASLGTFIARYYRRTWVGRTLCGKDLWFAWHRICMVLTWSLTSVAFVLIFLELRDWSAESNPHAILGTIVTALCFIQPIGAFFRPHPGTPNRPVFNWLHWFGGNAAHILAIITIFFAIKLTKASLPEWLYPILATFVAFHFFMHIIISILSCVSDKSANQRVTSFPMKDLGSPGKMNAHSINSDAPNSLARKLLLGLYVLVVVVFTTVLILVTVFAPVDDLFN